jgi:polyhydroxybutyrate depolymerase
MGTRFGIFFGLMIAAAAVAAAATSGGSTSRAAPAAPAATAATSPACRPGDRMLRLSVDGEAHEALLHIPRGAHGRIPVLIAFHGAQYGARFVARYYGLTPVSNREHFAVLYPQASHNTFWQLSPSQHEDVDAVRALLGRMKTMDCIDSTRVYATGASNGGGFAARVGCELADSVAAIAPVAGGYSALGPCAPSRPLPVLEIHGTRDQVVPYGGKPPDYDGSVARFLGEWTDLDSCRGSAGRSTPMHEVTVLVWRKCAAGSVVEHIRLAGTDHGWPGGDTARAGLKNHPIPRSDPTGLEAAEAVWSFVSRFRLAAR